MAVMRRRPTPAPAQATEAPAPPAPAARGPVRRRIVPIVAATPKPAPEVAAELEEAGADAARDKAIVQRYVDRIKNPKTAIRARCIQCCNGQVKEVQLCPATTCALHQFRMGVNPFHKRTGTTRAGTTEEAEGDDD